MLRDIEDVVSEALFEFTETEDTETAMIKFLYAIATVSVIIHDSELTGKDKTLAIVELCGEVIDDRHRKIVSRETMVAQNV